jgi:hypothetical protein
MDAFRNRKVIVGSVAVGPYTNYGNRLIEQASLRLLGLPPSTPRFSVFEPIGDDLLEYINSHDYVVITGCTTLQDDPGHQRCFDHQFPRIRATKICFGASFYCEPEELPSLRIARLYDAPIGARDPWTAAFLSRNGIAVELIGCPTLLDCADVEGWRDLEGGYALVSSSPPIRLEDVSRVGTAPVRWLKHDPWSPGEELRDSRVFDGAWRVITGRLHAALPAIARGIPVHFYGRQHWEPDYATPSWGDVRYSLLAHLGVSFDGKAEIPYPANVIRSLRRTCVGWLHGILGQ